MDVFITPAVDLLKTSVGNNKGTSSGSYIGTSVEDVLRTTVGDIPWHYTQDHMGKSIGSLLGTSSSRHNFAEWVVAVFVFSSTKESSNLNMVVV